LLWCFNRL